jgi:hypothetical protein
VDHDVRWGKRVCDALERRVEPLKELKIHASAGTVEGEVESWRTHQVKLGEIVPSAQHAADGEAWRIQFLKAAKMRFWGAWLAGVIGEASGGAGAVSDREQPGEPFLGKPTENDTAI